jgi:hypothetical protein
MQEQAAKHIIPTEQTQQDLETIFSKYQLLPELRREYGEFLSKTIDKNNPDFELYVDILVQIYLHKQADIETMVGILSPKYGNPQEVANKLITACEKDILDYNQNTKRFVVIHSISPDIEAMLERYQYPLPMIIPPKILRSNKSSGYLTIDTPVVLNGSSYFKDKDLCLDHLNKANQVALCLDFLVIDSPQGKYSKPIKKINEDSKEYLKRVKQATVFFTSSMEIMRAIGDLTSKFYLTHRYDRRGRVYASGYHINTQGSDYYKAVIQLANKELISDE